MNLNTEQLTKRAVAALPREIRAKIPSAPLPVLYEEAVRALAACVTIEEAKTWSDKAEALAVWAKLCRDDRAAKEARQLKLKAYRQMTKIADELYGYRAHSALVSAGLNKHQASRAIQIGRAEDDKFEAVLQRGIGTTRAAIELRKKTHGLTSTDDYCWLTNNPVSGPRLAIARSALRSRPAREVAAGISERETANARALAIEIIEWLDEFERALPK